MRMMIAWCGIAALCVACGGTDGSGDTASNPPTAPPSSTAPQPPTPPSPGPQPPVPAPAPVANKSPVVARANADQRVITGHPFAYDATQGGAVFDDPDGDRLDYEVTFEGSLHGLTAAGPQVAATLPDSAAGTTVKVTITARDGRGGIAADDFVIDVARNSPPMVVRGNSDRLLMVGARLDHDAAQGGQTFRDPDGDALIYELTLSAQPQGLRAEGARVVGTLDDVGAVRVRVTASDGFGGTARDTFMVAAPAPEPGLPTLPAESFVYDDWDLDLPPDFRRSRENGMPFHDTTPPDNPTTDAGATLGRVLFYDKRLSITNTLSCGSCHQQRHGFATSQRLDVGVIGEPVGRNSMALANARYNRLDRYFFDARAVSLERQVLIPIETSLELGQPLPLLVRKLIATDFYPPLFQAAFGTPEINDERIAKALAQFVRAMISYRARFDRAYHIPQPDGSMPDPATVLTAQELRGEMLYRASNCAVCHFQNVHTVGDPVNTGLDVMPADPGAGAGRFRSPSLRNIAVSGPYMHDGRFDTLRQVIDFYDSGVQENHALAPSLRTGMGTPRRLSLTEEDKVALEAFLGTLTDTELLTDPKFSDPFE